MAEHINLKRQFEHVEADIENDPEKIRNTFNFRLNKQLSWEELLENDRIVILAEAGTGKTDEFKAITKLLQEEDKLAFFCRIEILEDLGIKGSLDIETQDKFNEWMSGNEEAYFFLDSVDEARLKSQKSFELALKTFATAIKKKEHQAKVFVSCRVSNWRATADLELFSKLLPSFKKRFGLPSV